MGKGERKKLIIGLAFVSPWLLGFFIFYIYPFIASIYYSFTVYHIISPPEFIGLRNYVDLITRDPLFVISIKNTLYYAGISIPLGIVMGIIIALLLNAKVKGMAFYRTIFFLPVIVPFAAHAILWKWILHPKLGVVNYIIELIGIKHPPGWFQVPGWSKPALIIMALWASGQAIIIYLAGLQDIPKSLFEVADLDGANWFQKILHITLPMISNVVLFNLVMGLIQAFQFFTQPFIITKGTGRPMDSMLMYNLYLYQQAFKFFNMGYACAMAWMLFVAIILITLFVFKTSKSWVFYGGE
ncbi:MAG TPA: sugar ABC transporter permease [Spirochaetes bacterium]|nr:sugar ABC transporter permease [Spirochaetota bacterium]